MIYSDKIKYFDEYVDPCLCNAWVATAVIGAGLIGAGATIYSANKAADAQRASADKASSTALGMYERTREDLAPYRAIGNDASERLKSKLTDLTTPISVNPDDFLGSDYYKFLETQGLKGVQNSFAARGLTKAGAALKGSAAFLKGLNSQEWQNNFNMQNINQTNAYSRLKALVDTGENASAQTGSAGTSAANTAAGATIGAGNATAAAYNATGGAVKDITNNIAGYAMYKGLYGGSNGPITLGGPNGPTPFAA